MGNAEYMGILFSSAGSGHILKTLA